MQAAGANLMAALTGRHAVAGGKKATPVSSLSFKAKLNGPSSTGGGPLRRGRRGERESWKSAKINFLK